MTASMQLMGEKFGRLEVVGKSENDKHGKTVWECKCECGKIVRVGGSLLKNGNTKSCGCLRREVVSDKWRKHGRSKTRLYGTWKLMIHRCENPSNGKYADYGGRGIKVCARWRESFAAFLEDMGERPEGCELDRIDNDGDYEPGNVRWATLSEQRRNTRANRKLEHGGKRLLLVEWAEKTGVAAGTIAQRIKRGWTVSKALTTPVRNGATTAATVQVDGSGNRTSVTY